MLVIAQPPSVLVDLVCRGRHQQRLLHRIGQLEGQFHVTLHVVQGILALLEFVVYDCFSLVLQKGAVQVRDGQDLEQVFEHHADAIRQSEALSEAS